MVSTFFVVVALTLARFGAGHDHHHDHDHHNYDHQKHDHDDHHDHHGHDDHHSNHNDHHEDHDHEQKVVPSAALTWHEAIKTQLQFLQRGDVRGCFAFASPANKASTGPLQHFEQMLRRSYSDMIGSDWYDIQEMPTVDTPTATCAEVNVTKTSMMTVYEFCLSKQPDTAECSGCWMTDGVRPVRRFAVTTTIDAKHDHDDHHHHDHHDHDHDHDHYHHHHDDHYVGEVHDTKRLLTPLMISLSVLAVVAAGLVATLFGFCCCRLCKRTGTNVDDKEIVRGDLIDPKVDVVGERVAGDELTMVVGECV